MTMACGGNGMVWCHTYVHNHRGGMVAGVGHDVLAGATNSLFLFLRQQKETQNRFCD